jgi:hypothetical protein
VCCLWYFSGAFLCSLELTYSEKIRILPVDLNFPERESEKMRNRTPGVYSQTSWYWGSQLDWCSPVCYHSMIMCGLKHEVWFHWTYPLLQQRFGIFHLATFHRCHSVVFASDQFRHRYWPIWWSSVQQCFAWALSGCTSPLGSSSLHLTLTHPHPSWPAFIVRSLPPHLCSIIRVELQLDLAKARYSRS